MDSDFEISLRPLDIVYLCTGDQINIQMPADLDQFRGDDSHGTVIGREGLVQFTHYPTDGRRFFY